MRYFPIYVLASVIFLLSACRKPTTLNDDEAVRYANSIIAKMSLEEKIAQLEAGSFINIKKAIAENGDINRDTLVKYYPYGFGAINLDFKLTPEDYVKTVNELQAYNLSLKNAIPVIFLGEGLHGLMSNGATVFPQAIALGCSWDTKLLEKVYTVTAIEAHARGIRQLLSPVLDLAREPRFGRIEEMYSEDPYLTGMLGLSAVRGFQQTDSVGNYFVGATLKHFVGHGQPEGGRNTSLVSVSAQDIMNNHLQPFEMIIREGDLAAVMPAYNEVCDVPVHASEWLVSDVLRKQLGFNGLVISDQNAVDQLYQTHHVAKDAGEAAYLAIRAGINLDLVWLRGTFSKLDSLVRQGVLAESEIDNSVRKLLVLKHKLDLFNFEPLNVEKMLAFTNNESHKQIALEAAHKTMVLLKNENKLLPLDPTKIKRLAVIGPNAADVHFGGYTAEPRSGISVLAGIESFAQGKFDVEYAEGCKIALETSSFWEDNCQTPNSPDDDRRLIAEAVKTAKRCDVVLLVIGETVAFAREAWSEWHRGDRESLELLGMQNQLFKEMIATGKPVVVLMINGRPLAINDVARDAHALIECFYPGQEGGTAVADVLFGKVNPSGKLAVTFPKSVGELPCFYNHKPSRSRSYVYTDSKPLFPFGFGLSYTTFEYSDPLIDRQLIKANETVSISVTIKNTGSRYGEEIVQLYLRDNVSKGVRPVKELKRFAKIGLEAGESETVVFELDEAALSYYNPQLQKVAEPGMFTVMIGPSSDNLRSVSFELAN
jgi:beta-glucosidase